MPEISAAFLNSYHFYEAKQDDKDGPQTTAEFEAKRDSLAQLLLRVCNGTPPDVIGLTEIGTQKVAQKLGHAIQGNIYEECFLPAPQGSDLPQGLAVLYRPEKLRLLATQKSPNQGRPYWFALLFQCQEGRKGAFWFVVNHWKSNYGSSFRENEKKRIESAQSLSDFYYKTAAIQSDTMMLAGDFNCEPWERPFRGLEVKWKAVRDRRLVTRPYNKSLYLYNLMWRWLGEPDHLEATLEKGYVASRLRGTFQVDVSKRDMDWRVWDQFLVTKPFLTQTGLIRLRESSLRGVYPMRGESDHAAIAVRLDV